MVVSKGSRSASQWLVIAFWVIPFLMDSVSHGQNDPLKQALATPLMPIEQVDEQFKDFIQKRIKKLELPQSSEVWAKQAEEIRRQVLEEVVFKGAPQKWRQMSVDVRKFETLETANGYTIERMLIEALPGMWIPALIYIPDGTIGVQVPAVLNVNGHAPEGKAYKEKQYRCIQQVKSGMVAMNIEWLGMGQLRTDGYQHNHLGKLDILGMSGLSVFYRAMQCGLDVLEKHDRVDSESLAVTGLSGGGWQTIILSALDKRVKLCVPVAGHSALAQRLDHPGSIGDLEQVPTDLAVYADYTPLNALMVPRPMLMIYNAKDNCCFVASTVKANTYDPTVPFYELAGLSKHLAYYENQEPGDHNYGLDNRLQLYQFLDLHFHPFGKSEIKEEVKAEEILTAEQLGIPVPEKNQDFDTLAAGVARDLPLVANRTFPQLREQLRETLKYPEWSAFAERFTGPRGVGEHIIRYLKVKTGDELSINVSVIEGADSKKVIVLLADSGVVQQTARVRELVQQGYRVIAMDPLLIGLNKPSIRLYQTNLFVHTVGERTLGLQAAQINTTTEMLRRVLDLGKVDVMAIGPRMSLAVRCAVALSGPENYDKVATEGELKSLDELIVPTATYAVFPEAYCFGLMRHFDLPVLKLLGTAQR